MATNLVGQLKVGKVNCVEHRTLCDKYAVKGYPTIKFFASGEKTEDKIIDYGEGSRSSGVLESWALEKKILYEPAKFDQLISEEIFKSYCREAKGICLIAFLPHIYDTTKEERNSYLDVLKEVIFLFSLCFKYIFKNIHNILLIDFLYHLNKVIIKIIYFI